MNAPFFGRPWRPMPKTSPRDKVLAAWRGVDLAPIEKAKAVTSKALKDIMPKIAADLRLDRRQSETEVLKVWNHLLDPNITAHAQPTGLNKGTLFVTVDSSVWLDEIVRYRRREILQRLQHSFGPELIKKISFRVG